MIQTNPRIRGLIIMADVFNYKSKSSVEVKITADIVATGKFYHFVKLSNDKISRGQSRLPQIQFHVTHLNLVCYAHQKEKLVGAYPDRFVRNQAP